MSKKVAVITDTNSMFSSDEAKELGIEVIPFPFFIDGTEYTENVDLTQEKFYEILNSRECSCNTSQPSIGLLMETFERVLEEYDEAVAILLSSGLSRTYETASTVSQEFDGRIQVINNQRVSVSQKQSVKDACELVKKGYSAVEIKEILERTKFDSTIYIKVETLKYLKKGGRLTPAAALLGTILKIKPVLSIYGEKLDSFAKARTSSACKTIMIDAIKSDIEKAGLKPGEYDIHVAYTYDLDSAKEFVNEVKEIFGVTNVICDPLSLTVSCHIGPGALALSYTKKLDELK